MPGKKLPWFPFFARDWLGDPQLGMCREATRGIWIDALAAMHERSRTWYLKGTVEQLSRVLRTTPHALAEALADLRDTGAADVHEHTDGTWTLTSRRFKREAEKRCNTAERVSKYRANQVLTCDPPTCNAGVTLDLQMSEADCRESQHPPPGLAAERGRSPSSWLADACLVWTTAFNCAKAPRGPIGKHLKPLVERDGWERVRAAWIPYVDQRDIRFCNAFDFASKLYGELDAQIERGDRPLLAKHLQDPRRPY